MLVTAKIHTMLINTFANKTFIPHPFLSCFPRYSSIARLTISATDIPVLSDNCLSFLICISARWTFILFMCVYYTHLFINVKIMYLLINTNILSAIAPRQTNQQYLYLLAFFQILYNHYQRQHVLLPTFRCTLAKSL